MKASMIVAAMGLAMSAGAAHAQGCGAGEVFPTRQSIGGLSGGTGFALAAGDFDGDGRTDIVTVGTGDASLSFGAGVGAFEPVVLVDFGSLSALDVAVADLDGDGFDDFVAAEPTGRVSVVRSNGDRTFAMPETYAFFDRTEHVLLADVDGDGNLDMVVGDQDNPGSNNVMAYRLGNGDGTFGGRVTRPLPGFVRDLASADANTDGFADVVVANDLGATVFLGGLSGLTESVTLLGRQARGVALADATGDGVVDAIVSTNDPDMGGVVQIGVLAGDGVGGFAAPVYSGGRQPTLLAAADIDGDGDIDVADISGDTAIWINDGTGLFAPTVLGGRSSRQDVLLADLDNDGDPDLANTGSSANDYWLNQCVAFPPVITRQPPTSVVVDAGTTARISIEAGLGTPPLAYQWRRNGAALVNGGAYSGVDTEELTIQATSEQTDVYDVVVSNASGSATSAPVVLAVRDACVADLDGDGLLTLFDFLAFQNAFDAGCP